MPVTGVQQHDKQFEGCKKNSLHLVQSYVGCRNKQVKIMCY